MDHHALSLGFLGGGLNSAVGATHFISCRMDGLFTADAGAFSRRPEVNRQTAEQWGVSLSRTYPNLDALLAEEAERLDALVVLTPTPDHAAAVAPALEMGLPVICEKALTSTSAEARHIADTVTRTSGFLAVTFNYSGYPMVRELRRMILDGQLGSVTQVHAEMPQEGFVRVDADGHPAVPQTWRTQDATIPTLSLDLGDHLYHLVRFLTGERPIEVMATESTHGNIEGVIDNVVCLARYSGDLDCSFWFGKSALGHRNGLRLRIYGRTGAAEWRQTNPEELIFTDARGQTSILDRSSVGVKVANQPRYTRFKVGHPAGFIEAFANLYNDIGQALVAHREGAPIASEYIVDAKDAVDGLLTLEAMAMSARTRAWTTIPSRNELWSGGAV